MRGNYITFSVVIFVDERISPVIINQPLVVTHTHVPLLPTYEYLPRLSDWTSWWRRLRVYQIIAGAHTSINTNSLARELPRYHGASGSVRDSRFNRRV